MIPMQRARTRRDPPALARGSKIATEGRPVGDFHFLESGGRGLRYRAN